MTNKEILEKAIKKAKTHGWDSGDLEIYAIPIEAPVIIFNHQFAKALWGEGRMSSTNGLDRGGMNMFEPKPIGDWKSHLQMMVVAPDPIKYLSDNLPE